MLSNEKSFNITNVLLAIPGYNAKSEELLLENPHSTNVDALERHV